jgi:hypothetical protein
MAFEKELIAAMGNPEAARAWRTTAIYAEIARMRAVNENNALRTLSRAERKIKSLNSACETLAETVESQHVVLDGIIGRANSALLWTFALVCVALIDAWGVALILLK